VNQHSQHAVSSSQLQLDEYRSKLNQGVELHVDIEQNAELNLPVSVLNMVLKNLVENAIRFTESGEIRVKISNKAIQVIDSGSGLTEIPETEHGLGLLIVQRICQSYGWRFQLLNNPQGKGCAATMERI
jgi:signal transduction histidine kinase